MLRIPGWRRWRWWTLGFAVCFKLLRGGAFGLFPPVPLEQLLPPVGRVLDFAAGLVLVVFGIMALRWIARRYLFKVSRRLGLAFFFVGVVPLLWFALFILGMSLMGIVQVATREAETELEAVISETAAVADRAQEFTRVAELTETAEGGWGWIGSVADRPAEVAVWIDPAAGAAPRKLDTRPGRGDPEASAGTGVPQSETAWLSASPLPGWLRHREFTGMVGTDDAIWILATRTKPLRDGRSAVTLAARRLDEDVAARIAARTGFETRVFPAKEILTHVRSDTSTADARLAVQATRETDLDDSTARAEDDSLSFSMGVTLDERGWVGSGMIGGEILNWADGDTLDFWRGEEHTGALRFPLMGFTFHPFGVAKDLFTLGGRASGEMGLIVKIVGGVTLGMMLVAILIGVVLTSSVTRAVSALDKGTKRIAAGDLRHRIRVKSRDQLGALAGSFNQMTESVDQLMRDRAEKESLERELAIAADVQRSMLPKRFPTIPGLEGAARCIMAKQVGGDLYDFIPIGNDRIAIAIGDVSGKGVSAALVMSNVISSLRSMLVSQSAGGPVALLRELNAVLHESTSPERFVTLFYAEYDLRSGNLTYSNAGHDWPMIVRPEKRLIVDLESSGVMLGAFPELDLTQREISLTPGDVVVAYSDGLVDTENEFGEPFGRERASGTIAGLTARSPSEIVQTLERELRTWQGNAEEVDDVTLVVLKRVPLPGSGETTDRIPG